MNQLDQATQTTEELAIEVRCPHCQDEIAADTLSSSCVACHTPHHTACFAEHRGCSTTACGSNRARTRRGEAGEVIPRGARRVTCDHCRQQAEPEALVARCGCRRVLDVGCYQELGGCGKDGCARAIDLLPQAKLLADQHRQISRVIGIIGLVALVTFTTALIAGLATKGSAPPPGLLTMMIILFLAPSAFLLSIAYRHRHLARTLNELPPPRRPESAKRPNTTA